MSLSPLSVSSCIRNSTALLLANSQNQSPLLQSSISIFIPTIVDITHDTSPLLPPPVPLAPHSASVCAPHPPHALFQPRLAHSKTRGIDWCRSSCALRDGRQPEGGYPLVVSVSKIIEIIEITSGPGRVAWEAYLERQSGLSEVHGGMPPMPSC